MKPSSHDREIWDLTFTTTTLRRRSAGCRHLDQQIHWDLHLPKFNFHPKDGKNCKNSCSAVFGKGFPFNERYRFHSWKVGFELERLIDAAFLRWYRQPLICHTPVKFMMVLRDFSIDCKTPNDNNILRSRKNPPPPPNSQRHVTGIPPWKLTSPMEYDGWKMKFPYINFPGGGGILEVKILISWIHPEPSPAINRINPSRIKVFQLSL